MAKGCGKSCFVPILYLPKTTLHVKLVENHCFAKPIDYVSFVGKTAFSVNLATTDGRFSLILNVYEPSLTLFPQKRLNALLANG